MGYKRKTKIYDLDFAGTEQDGLEIRIRGLNLDQINTMQTDQLGNSPEGRRRLMAFFAEQLINWNMEDDDGQALPPTLDSIRTLDFEEFDSIIGAWGTAVAGVDAPLPQTSADGQPSVEASIPMAPPSDALAS